ncbi:MAG: TonB-dependent receptor [Opitutaceae bacterium]|nr:TonB-dependent receptor [Opitutaceae bacterium]
MSISSVESIEISRTSSADMDADAPAGTINMKTRRAFDRKGRRIGFNAALTLNTEEFHFTRNYGPDDNRNYKFRPAFGLDYSDVFLGQRLGVTMSLSRANSYSEQYRLTHTYNRTATAADPRPMVLTAIDFKDGPQFIIKDTATATVDFKAAPGLVLSLNTILNFSERTTFNRNLTFTAAANGTAAATGRQNVIGTLTDFRTNGLASNTSRTVGLGGGATDKITDTATIVPKFEYKAGALTFDGNGSYSKSKNSYLGLQRGFASGTAVNTVVGDWRATRPSEDSGEWTINQISGPDWFDMANFRNPRMSDDRRLNITEIYSGALNATWKLPLRAFPTSLKVGGKWIEETRKLSNHSAAYAWSYAGPGGGSTGSWADYPSPHLFDSGTTNALTVYNVANERGMIRYPNRSAIYTLYTEHPEYFVSTTSADNYFNAFIANTRHVRQVVSSSYGLADVRVSSRLQVRAGLRWEATETTSRETDPLPAAQVIAAGFPVNAARRASTIPGINYQYFSRPRIGRRSEYDNLFPSVSAKYSLGHNFQAQFGANKAIARPPLNAISGTWSIDDVNFIVTAPNPNLLPEYSKNYVARLAYYFEPVGSLTLTVTQNDITNLRESHEYTAEEFGYGDDPQFASYDFRAQTNNTRSRRFRGLEVGYSQSLSFLPKPLRGTTVNLAYTRAYASERRPGMSPHRASGNIAYSYGRFNMRVGAIWSDDTPFSGTYGRFRRHEIKFDLSTGWRVSNRLTLYAQGRNVLNGSNRNFDSPRIEGEGAALQRLENHGVTWVFGVKGVF